MTFREKVQEILQDDRQDTVFPEKHIWRLKYGSLGLVDAILEAAKELVPKEVPHPERCVAGECDVIHGINGCRAEVLRRIES